MVQLNKHGEKGKFFLKHSIFNVTKNDGIIYVDNATNLNTRNDSEIALDVLDMNNNKVVPVQIFITGSAEDYDDTCGELKLFFNHSVDRCRLCVFFLPICELSSNIVAVLTMFLDTCNLDRQVRIPII